MNMNHFTLPPPPPPPPHHHAQVEFGDERGEGRQCSTRHDHHPHTLSVAETFEIIIGTIITKEIIF